MLSPLVMGNEFSGVVEKVGANVTGFAVGNRVYGRMPLGKIGAFAEFAAVDAGTGSRPRLPFPGGSGDRAADVPQRHAVL